MVGLFVFKEWTRVVCVREQIGKKEWGGEKRNDFFCKEKRKKMLSLYVICSCLFVCTA